MTARGAPADDTERFADRRAAMVEDQVEARGVRDLAVLDALRRVPRHLFVDAADVDQAYDDHPLSIGLGQTISQPYMVARMVELCALRADDRVLDVGAGSGYQAAVLARCCAWVYSLELLGPLARRAQLALQRAAVANVTVIEADGSLGFPPAAPYDAIIVGAGAPAVPPPLLAQLRCGGRLVIPVGAGRGLQSLQIHQRRTEGVSWREDTACRFVDLRGLHGWHDRED
ncbi:MAG: protein-L-isoaspartate(D-aspartate) O-methyltransferase [Proteobacteria bacterium]|nr:protein-L-isoaspartate(D-aspartate) O-methyltransferase [Pseudomonadota bacterium]